MRVVAWWMFIAVCCTWHVSSLITIDDKMASAKLALLGGKQPQKVARRLLDLLWTWPDDQGNAYDVANSLAQSAILCCSRNPSVNPAHCNVQLLTPPRDCILSLLSAPDHNTLHEAGWPVLCLREKEEGETTANVFSSWWYWVASLFPTQLPQRSWNHPRHFQPFATEVQEVCHELEEGGDSRIETVLPPKTSKRFLTVSGSLAAFGSVTGLNNQLLVIMKLLTASKVLNRTALVPPFVLHKKHAWYDFTSKDEVTEWQVSPFSSVFDVDHLRVEAGYSFLVCQSRDCSDFDVGADFSTGLLIPFLNEAHPDFVWNPPYEFLNQAILDSNGPLIRRLNLERALALQLTPLELFWLGVSWNQSSIFFGALRPHPTINRHALSFVHRELSNYKHTHPTANPPAPTYVGVHSRFDRHCQNRMRKLSSKLPPNLYLPYITSCTKTSATVGALLAYSKSQRGEKEDTCLPVFLARGPGGNTDDLLEGGAILYSAKAKGEVGNKEGTHLYFAYSLP